jgi:Zn-dependent protease with chaperone function
MRVRIFEYGLWFLVLVEFVVPFTLIVIGCAFHQLSKDDVAFFIFFTFLATRFAWSTSVLISPQLVVFTGETNISVGLRLPNGPLRKGIVVLNIGKPLMDSLSLVEFEAVLVHELAHKLVNKEFRIYSWLFDRSRISKTIDASSFVFAEKCRFSLYRVYATVLG